MKKYSWFKLARPRNKGHVYKLAPIESIPDNWGMHSIAEVSKRHNVRPEHTKQGWYGEWRLSNGKNGWCVVGGPQKARRIISSEILKASYDVEIVERLKPKI